MQISRGEILKDRPLPTCGLYPTLTGLELPGMRQPQVLSRCT